MDRRNSYARPTHSRLSTVLLIVCLGILLSLGIDADTAFCYTPEFAESAYYDSLKTLATDVSFLNSKSSSTLLSSLSTTDLLNTAKTASEEQDSVLLFTVVGYELISRINNGRVRLTSVISELEQISGEDEYYSYLLLTK